MCVVYIIRTPTFHRRTTKMLNLEQQPIRCFVFKEIDVNGQLFFQHYRLSEDTLKLEIDDLLEEMDHWHLINRD